MTELLTSAQMRDIEQAAIQSGAVTGLELMERAGQGVVEAVLEQWPDLALAAPPLAGGPAPQTPRDTFSPKKHRAVVLCGPGNNGGDGFVVARLLKERGWEVEVFLFGEARKLPPDARQTYERWSALGAVHPMTYQGVKQVRDPDVWVDSVFGIGLTRRATGELGKILCYLAGYGGDRAFIEPKMVAVDVPSGLDADSGEIPGKGAWEWAPPCPFCAMTVTFHRPGPGHVTGEGPSHCGTLIVKDIGL